MHKPRLEHLFTNQYQNTCLPENLHYDVLFTFKPRPEHLRTLQTQTRTPH